MPEARNDRPTVFRLLHSSGDRVITDRGEALYRLAGLPGAKLFVVPIEAPAASSPAAA